MAKLERRKKLKIEMVPNIPRLLTPDAEALKHALRYYIKYGKNEDHVRRCRQLLDSVDIWTP